MKVLVTLVALLCAFSFGIVFNLASRVFVPLVIAWFTLQIFRPIINFGNKIKLPTIANLILVIAVFFSLCCIGIVFFNAQVVEFKEVYYKYSPILRDLMTKVLQSLQIISEGSELTKNLMDIFGSYLRNIPELALSISSNIVLILVFFMFMLLESPFLNNKIDNVFSNQNAAKTKKIMSSVSYEISRYLGTLTLISLLTGVSAWAILVLAKVELAATWGVLTFLLNYIPTVGSIIATIPPVLMAILQFSPSYTKPIIVLLSLSAIQIFLGNFITPKVVGDRLGLSPVVILISLLLWGIIWGIPGAILSVPIAVIIKIICENFESLKPIAVMMGSGKSFVPAEPNTEHKTH
jgi:predicted PurR-regulated permease PerM